MLKQLLWQEREEMHNKPNVSYIKGYTSFFEEREAGVGYTISQFSDGSILVPGD